MNSEFDQIVGQAEESLARGFREEGAVTVSIRGIDASSVRTFLSNLLIAPNIDELEHGGLLIKDPLLDLYRRFISGKLEESYVLFEERTLSRADVGLLLGLARNRSLDKYKEGVRASFTQRLKVVARDHEKAIREKELRDLVIGEGT